MEKFYNSFRTAFFLINLVRYGKSKFLFYIFLVFFATILDSFGIMTVVPLIETYGDNVQFQQNFLLKYISSFYNELDKSDRLLFASFSIIFIMFGRGVVSYITGLYSLRFTNSIILNTTHHIIDILFLSKSSFINKMSYGSLYTLVNLTIRRSSDVIKLFTMILLQMSLLFMYIILLVSISFEITLSVFLFFLVIYNFFKILDQTQSKLGKKWSLVSDDLNQSYVEILSSIRDIHLFSATNQSISRINTGIYKNLSNDFFREALSTLSTLIINVFSGIFIGGIILFYLYSSNPDDFSWLGTVLIYILILSRMMGPMNQIIAYRSGILHNIGAFDQLMKFCENADKNKEKKGGINFDEIQNSIIFDTVTFSYDSELIENNDTENNETTKRKIAALHNISLEISAKSMVALVGPSGAGKTTFANMIARFYEPDSGNIYIDNKLITEYEVASLRSSIGFVSQESVIFNGSVRHNLLFANPQAAEDEIIQAAKFAQAHDFIMELEQGYDSQIGDKGVRLSGGQRQRIALARMFLKHPKIIILDEVTSNLDALTEDALHESLNYFRDKSTIIVIAHRLATVRMADQIFVLDRGEIVEQGNHQQLLEAKGLYAHLAAIQFTDTLSPAK